MTDTTTLAPTDAEIWREWELILATSNPTAGTAAIKLARTAIAKWGASAPASRETGTCKCCGEGSARIVVRRECDACTSVYAGVAEHRIQKSLAEPPAQEVRVPLSDAQKREMVTGYFAEDWAIENALHLLDDFERHGITAAQKETTC